MASERIPALASYLVKVVAPHLSEMIERLQRGRWHGTGSLIDEAFENARDRVDYRQIHRIFGVCDRCLDDRDRESLASMSHLCNEAIASAWENQKLWDRRRTNNTRANLICNLANYHIRCWMECRGMDIAEARRLRDGGDE